MSVNNTCLKSYNFHMHVLHKMCAYMQVDQEVTPTEVSQKQTLSSNRRNQVKGGEGKYSY